MRKPDNVLPKVLMQDRESGQSPLLSGGWLETKNMDLGTVLQHENKWVFPHKMPGLGSKSQPPALSLSFQTVAWLS